MNKKDIKPVNEKNQPHGYWETYYSDGNLRYKCNYVNGEPHDYVEWCDSNKIFILR